MSNGKAPKLNAKDFLNKDETRSNKTTCCHVKDGNLLATDGHRILVLRSYTTLPNGTYKIIKKGRDEVLELVDTNVDETVWSLYDGILERPSVDRYFTFHKILEYLKVSVKGCSVYYGTDIWESETLFDKPNVDVSTLISFNPYYLRELAGRELTVKLARTLNDKQETKVDGHAPMLVRFDEADFIIMPMRIKE